MKKTSSKDGQIKSFMLDDHSTSAVRAACDGHATVAIDDNGCVELQAVESVSILGKHNGVMDDDLFDMIDENIVD